MKAAPPKRARSSNTTHTSPKKARRLEIPNHNVDSSSSNDYEQWNLNGRPVELDALQLMVQGRRLAVGPPPSSSPFTNGAATAAGGGSGGGQGFAPTVAELEARLQEVTPELLGQQQQQQAEGGSAAAAAAAASQPLGPYGSAFRNILGFQDAAMFPADHDASDKHNGSVQTSGTDSQAAILTAASLFPGASSGGLGLPPWPLSWLPSNARSLSNAWPFDRVLSSDEPSWLAGGDWLAKGFTPQD